ncbi:anti-sigma factor [Sphingobacterium sp. lm-10]|uniref:anti-sigma factor n=1 Tax=Sphingobacterium sp. lm-10 TaxID=2944904 RepID=UPI002022826D|nr:anti-sigma factor [Sphingobacterium sp. lm-10]MCL7988326.1 anti-sigma factor [Sphingobacterium sp. lm-10]
MKENDIDKLFRDAAEDHMAKPSPQLWDRIAQQLDEEKESEEGIVPLIPLTKKRSYQWVKYAAACALIGVGLFAYFANQHESIDANTQIAQQKATVPNSSELKDVEQPKKDVTIHTESSNNASPQEKHLAYSPNLVQKEESIKNSPSVSTEQKSIASVNLPVANQVVTIEESEMADRYQVQLAEVPMADLPTRYVTEVDPIKPLIEPFEEEEEMMIAGTVRKATTNVINKIINVVNDHTPTQVTKDVYVTKDDEGSFRLEVGNLFAKNRIRKRK